MPLVCLALCWALTFLAGADTAPGLRTLDVGNTMCPAECTPGIEELLGICRGNVRPIDPPSAVRQAKPAVHGAR